MARIINNSDTTLSVEAQKVINNFCADMEVETVTMTCTNQYESGEIFAMYDENENHIGNFDTDGNVIA